MSESQSPLGTIGGCTHDPIFDGPGEMRALCRAFDWGTTSLGPVARWPLSLRVTIATLLASRHPMFLFWGPELIQFYNDAYRPSLAEGGRHPRALGAKGAEFWTEIWEIIGPQIAQVMSGGEATWHENHLVPIERNRRIEEVYWTYSYGPAFDDAGAVGGVLVVCQETTTHVLADRHLREAHAALAAERARTVGILEHMADAHFVVDNEFRFIAANAVMERGSATARSELYGRTIWELFPGAKGNVFERQYRRVVAERTEAHFTARYADSRLDLVVEVDAYPTDDGGIAVFCRDATSRAHAQETLRASEARYRTLYDSIDEGFCVIQVLFDDDGRPRDYRFLETNPAFEGQTGLSNAVGRTIREMVPGHETHWFETYGRIASTGKPERFVNEAKMLHRWYDVYAFRVGAPDERKVAILFNDITRRVRAEEMLRTSEERYRTLVENVSDYAIFLIDDKGTITDWTLGAARVMDYASDEAIGKHFSIFYTPEDVASDEPRRELAQAAETGRAEREGWRVRKGGERFWVNEIATAVRDTDGHILGFTKIARDLTERRIAEAAAERARAEAQRDALRRQLAQGEEEERRRLARELHDEAGQHLTALSLGLRSLADVAPPGSEVDRRAAQLSALANTLGQELHALALRLRPKALDEFGLEAALSAYVEEWGKQSGMAVDVHSRLAAGRLPVDVESAVYRIVQEALTNVAKHSGARRASVHVERRDGLVVAIVEDNGRGFDVAAPRASHRAGTPPALGLLGIRERATLLGGTVEIESAPEEGTTLFVRIPVAVPHGDAEA